MLTLRCCRATLEWGCHRREGAGTAQRRDGLGRPCVGACWKRIGSRRTVLGGRSRGSKEGRGSKGGRGSKEGRGLVGLSLGMGHKWRVNTEVAALGEGGRVLGELDSYAVIEILGKGGNATTYKCLDGEKGIEVAVKEMSLRSMKTWKQLELFEREAKILRALDHPGVPKYIDYFEKDTEDDRRFYIVQELAGGMSLQDMVDGGQRFSDDEVAHILLQMLDVLAYLGNLRPPVVHRDIKPSNIIVENPGDVVHSKVMLVDFGGVQANVNSYSGVPDSTVVGTFEFLAPEQLRGKANISSDVYSLGVTMLYVASGVLPSALPESRMKLDLTGVQMNPTLKRVVAGFLEPVAEDRLRVEDAIRIVGGLEGKQGRSVGGSLFERRVSLLDAGQGDPHPGHMVLRKPVGTRVVVKHTDEALEIYIPPAKFDGASLSTGTFAIFWNAFVAFWTVNALAAGGAIFAAFSIPFWVAGAGLLKSSFGRQFIAEKIEINPVTWMLEKNVALFSQSSQQNASGPDWENSAKKRGSGYTSDLSGASVEVVGYINGVPETQMMLRHGVEKVVFGEGLEPVEQEWIAGVIQEYCNDIGAGTGRPTNR